MKFKRGRSIGRMSRGDEAGMFSASSEADDFALARRMRAIAVELRTEGRTCMRLSAGAVSHVRELTRRIGQANGPEGGAVLESLAGGARIMEACALQARQDRVKELPASGNAARIACVLEALCGRGDVRLTRERLMLALASFDDVQTLEMAELWAVPEAVRISIMRAYRMAAEAALEIVREGRLAERWMLGEEVPLARRQPAFYVRALQRASEQESAELYARLERHVLEKGSSVEQIVQEAHAREAIVKMRLDNLLADKRMIDALDWKACFEELSAVEAELRYDPLGTYPSMDDDSRAEVRAQAAAIARRLRVSELTVARHAVNAAQAARYESAPEARQTVCYWLYDDEGRSALLERMGANDKALPRRIPDPTGRGTVWGLAILTGLLYALFMLAVESPWLIFPGIPLAWCAATALLGRLYPRLIKPARLLKLEVNRVPEELRTLVVMPALLSSKKRAEEICDQLEALGSLEKDENISHLILGDFADGDAASAPGDGEIVEYVRGRLVKMNERAGREQFYYLHRERKLLEADGRWMGRDRKRGALTDLNRLLVDEPGAERAFATEGAACGRLKGRYRYVLTLDADTRYLPGTVQRLIGTMAHPLNAPRMEEKRRKGYAVLQPQMEMMAGACVNGFVRLFAGAGGLNTYPVSVSNYWQDVTGVGIYGGKGLYDVRAFHAALEGALPEGRILSHDLIEGTLARAALVNDVCFYDGYPSTLASFLRRLNRWTRGDWQLLPQLVSLRRYPGENRRLTAAERLRLLDNLLRSMHAPALLAVLTTAVWMGNADALLAGMIAAYWLPLLSFPRLTWNSWKRATAELAILPATAACTADAALRTLWRLAFTKRHLLDWVTAADAEGMAGGQALPCRVAAILMLPGLLDPMWIPGAIGFALLFAVAPEWIGDMEQTPIGEPRALEGRDISRLLALAADTWRFFDRYVGASGNWLPPDNVQLDPDAGAAQRSSPTNIGLYLMSCLSAESLGLLDTGEMLERMERAVQSVERMEKWRGHLYNWYDIGSLSPLNPRYVSSVDSGNFAAALLLCAEAIEEPGLAGRMRDLARGMDFTALYDGERQLFTIGMDVDHGRLSGAHYDLLASEARILSYTAMMLGQVPIRHWTKLSRTAVAAGNRAALISWSGTMFEYLMPALFQSAPEQSLLSETLRAVVDAQIHLGRRKNRPWGVSESGYCAFDLHLNYQYRAFGLRELSLSGSVPEDVVAPYASVLALAVDPKRAVNNIEHMQELGWQDECGFYEAADYLHPDASGAPRLVKSHMAHHQGMILCALCNALTDRKLVRTFMRIPEARALSLLMEERAMSTARLGRRVEERTSAGKQSMRNRDERAARYGQRLADAHLLGGAGATVLATADGAMHYQRDGVLASRFQGDLLNRGDGACVHLRRERTGENAVLGEANVIYEPGAVRIIRSMGPLQCEMTACVSPEDGALLKRLVIRNTSGATETLRVADCVPVALGRLEDMLAHPVFRHLFVESERIAQCAVALKRRPRSADESSPVLMHLVSTPGSIQCETDMERLLGRMGSTLQPGGIRWNMSNTVGATLNPCSALETVVTIAARQRVELHFAMGLTEAENQSAWLERNFAEAAPERAIQLSSMQARAMLGFLGLDATQHQILQRLSALLFDAHLRASTELRRGEALPVARSELWSLGISGDLPILLLRVHLREEIARVREVVRIHEFFRTLGVRIDLALVNEYGNDYDQPVRDAISDAIAFTHLNDLRGKPGGVHLLEGQNLTPVQREALHRGAAVDLDGAQDLYLQLRSALSVLNLPLESVRRLSPGENRLAAIQGAETNGYGCFLADGRYAIDVLPDRTTPAPWSNLMANDDFGVLLTERGGGFLWADNSRSDRLTAFGNDALDEGWGWMLYLVDDESGAFFPLLPGKKPGVPFRVLYSPAETIYRFETEGLSGELAICVRRDAQEMRMHVTLRSAAAGNYRLVGFVDWLMGVDARDAGFVRTWSRDGACFAVGTSSGVGYLAAANARAQTGGGRNAFLGRGSIQAPEGVCARQAHSEGWVLSVPFEIQEARPIRLDWALGFARENQQAYARVRGFYAQHDYEAVRAHAMEEWNGRLHRMVVETPDQEINRMANTWLIHQTLTGRIRARTGLYQPGGAYGFRDQLQDMLALLPFEPARVREHILRCAARQFEDGDVMHWWHEPYLGVRTRISDDLLFLPFVAARYVQYTGDAGILSEEIPYLENVEIEAGKEDRFAEMRPSERTGSLHDHCMRAFRRAAVTGSHGLALMGSGDWNDGMNRVGAQGRGESVWLSEFLSVCAMEYAACISSQTDCAWLSALADQMNAAVENAGWDGGWYLRAYTDGGLPLGSASGSVCRIDAISQAWAVFAQLDAERCERAMDAAWQMLVDEEIGMIRLLTPAFTSDAPDPGYIRGYPAGIRENGAQYTHAACWLLLAMIKMGDEQRAHRALQMLLPANHARTREQAEIYRTEPYVMAADVYDAPHAGRGGWTWYTGSASWMYQCILALLGFERRGNRVRLNALLGDWPEAAVRLRFGAASYRLISRQGVDQVYLDGAPAADAWLELSDDGREHEALFPPQNREAALQEAPEPEYELQKRFE